MTTPTERGILAVTDTGLRLTLLAVYRGAVAQAARHAADDDVDDCVCGWHRCPDAEQAAQTLRLLERRYAANPDFVPRLTEVERALVAPWVRSVP